MNETVALLVGLVAGFLAALGVANMLGKNGAAQTKTQSWIAIGVGVFVCIAVFSFLAN